MSEHRGTMSTVESPAWWQHFGKGYWQRADGQAEVTDYREADGQGGLVLRTWQTFRAPHKITGANGRMLFRGWFHSPLAAMVRGDESLPFDPSKMADWKAAEFNAEGHLLPSSPNPEADPS